MVRIEKVQAGSDAEAALGALLIDAVESNAGVSFLAPLVPEKARAFWRASLAEAAKDNRVVYGAYEGAELVGTVTLVLDCPENQPHRGEIAKMIVHRKARRKGIAAALLATAEREAKSRGKTLLTLDAVPGEAGERLYLRSGWIKIGEIPRYALQPDRSWTATSILYKPL